MAKQCNYKKKGFRQMSMETDPYELDSMNTNMSKQSKATAEAIYGDPQGAMMVGNVQLQQQDTSAYSKPAGVMQSSSGFGFDSSIPSFRQHTLPPVTVSHNFSGSVGNVQNVQQDTSGYTATSPALGNTLTGDTANDVAFFSNTNDDTDKKEGNTGWAAGALYRDEKTLEAKKKAAEEAGRHKKVARIEKRITNFKARNDTDPTTNPTGKFNEFTKKISDGIGGLFKKKP
jgi:hypothetical protein